MKRTYTCVIVIQGKEMARSTPMPMSECKLWILNQKRYYSKLLEGRNWWIYLETPSVMENNKTKNV